MTTRLLFLALILPFPVLQGQTSTTSMTCVPITADTARFGSTQVFAACEVQAPARLKRATKPSMIDFPDGVSCLIAELEFVVDEAGAPVPSTAVVLSATTAAYGAEVLKRLGQWRYAPAVRDGTPVRSLVVGRMALADPRRPSFVVTREGAPTPSSAPGPACR